MNLWLTLITSVLSALAGRAIGKGQRRAAVAFGVLLLLWLALICWRAA